MKKIILRYKHGIAFILMVTGMLAGVFTPLQRSYAQNITPQPMPCGGYHIDFASLRKAREAASNGSNRIQTLTPYLVRIYFHILRESNGSNPCATEAQVLNEFNTLSADYAPFNICFLNAGWDYVDNSHLDTNYNVNTDPPGDFDPYKIPYSMDVFYLSKIKGNNAAGGGIGGYTFFIGWDCCIVAAGNLGASQTTSHEVGHCFGLWHTFEKFGGYEDINGANWPTTGDFIQDTPADPYAHITDTAPSCFSIIGCLYSGNCTDPNGQTNFSPPYTNLMAYWSPGACYTNRGITTGQYDRIYNTYLPYNYHLTDCESPANATQGSVNVTSGYHMASAINTLTTNGSVNFSSTAIATLGGGTVLLEPGFHAYPSGGGRVLIRGAVCNFVPRYSNNPEPGNDKSKSVVLTCVPNPANGFVNIQYQLPGDGQASITLSDITGRMVKEILPVTILARGQHENIVSLNELNSGVYFVTMNYDERTSFAKLIVAK